MLGLDPTKKETTPGIPDSVAKNKLFAKNKPLPDRQAGVSGGKEIESGAENLTQTDKFSRELFATVAAASQKGTLDQAAIEQLSSSLADKIKNSPPRKVFSLFDIKTTNNDTVQAFTNYNNALDNIYKKYPPMNYTILDVLQKFIIDENNVDASALTKLDPIIKQTNKVIEEMVKTSAPESISNLHLSVINSQQRLAENLSDIRLYDSDPIMALGGISQYQKNATRLKSDLYNLANAIIKKFNN